MKEILSSILTNEAESITTLFMNLQPGKSFSYHTSTLCCADIENAQTAENPKANPVEGTKAQEFFKEFITINNAPCLYVYEILSKEISTERILHAYRASADSNKQRSFSAIRVRPDLNSSYLYIGKVQKGIGGRQIVHLGLYKQGATGGLQMFYWAKELNLRLKIHVIAFKDKKFSNYLVPLENALAALLKPLIGKHK